MPPSSFRIHHDVGRHHPLGQRRPLVGGEAVLAHVGVDAGREVVVDGADLVDGDARGLQDGDRAIEEALRVRGRWRRLQGAVDDQGGQVAEVPWAVFAQPRDVWLHQISPSSSESLQWSAGSGAMTKLNDSFARLPGVAPLVLRLAIGGIMAYHGFDKLAGGLGVVEEMFVMMDVPAAAAAAPFVTFVEILGGLALIAGIATRVAAALLAFVLLGALVLVKADLGIISSGPMPGAELDIALLAGLVALAFIGPGSVSADRALGLERQPVVV